MSDTVIRLCRSDDRDALYAVCLATGDAGSDATHVYTFPELLGHLYVGPYLALEPRVAFALEDAQGVAGYALAATDSVDFAKRMELEWLPPLRARYPYPAGSPATWTADDRIVVELHAQASVPPFDPSEVPAHLHIDLLPRVQGRGYGTRMMQHLLETLRQLHVPAVGLGASQRNHLAIGFYRKLGFQQRMRDEQTVWMSLLL